MTSVLFNIILQIPWDDEEERLYRDWLRQERQKCEDEIDFDEYQSEEDYRAKLREETKNLDDGEPINWEDIKEREFRRRYIEMRQV